MAGPVRVEGVQVAGDEQADPTVHGGPTKSVYSYPWEHYRHWRELLDPAGREILDVPGAFGENLTTEGFVESEVGVGDLLRIGSVLLLVTEPRMPCAKLGLRFRDPLMTRRFHEARRNGVYFAIEEAGELQAGDEIRVEHRHPLRLSIQDVVDLETGGEVADGTRERAAGHPALSGSWRDRFRAPEG